VDSSGNVGIGTSSPSARLQANTTINTVYSSSDTLTSGVIAYIRNDSSTNATAATLRLDALGSANVAAASISSVHTGDGASALTFGTRTNGGSNVTERMRIDASGNVGIGGTVNLSAAQSTDGQIRISNTTTRASGNKYGIRFADSTFETNAAIYAEQGGSGNNASALVFGTNGGTGGIALTSATERMRIDSSGNLLVGTTSGTGRLTVADGTTAVLTLRATSAIDPAGRIIGTINFQEPEGTGDGTLTVESSISALREGSDAFNSGGYLTFSTRPFNGSLTERLRIDASGNLGLGVTPSAWGSNYSAFQFGYGGNLVAGNGTFPSYVSIGANYYLDSTPTAKYLQTAESSLYQQNGGEHQWFIAPSGTAGNTITFTEAARIDTSGNLLVGTTSVLAANRRLQVDGGALIACLFKNSASANEVINVWNSGTSGDNVFVQWETEAAGTARGTITYNRAGGLVAYNTTSDYRAKDIAGAIFGASDTVLNLKPYMGTMKGATIERPMFIAHETQEIAPYAVVGEKDAVDNDGNPIYQQMDHSALVPLLTAALQEALTEIASLKARLDAANL
jgi:hypothetical protein